MPSFPDRVPNLPDPHFSSDERPEPVLSPTAGRASSRLLRARREAPASVASGPAAAPLRDVPATFTLTAGDRIIVSSEIASPGSSRHRGSSGMLRTSMMVGVVFLALIGILSLGHMFLGLMPSAVAHLAHLG